MFNVKLYLIVFFLISLIYSSIFHHSNEIDIKYVGNVISVDLYSDYDEVYYSIESYKYKYIIEIYSSFNDSNVYNIIKNEPDGIWVVYYKNKNAFYFTTPILRGIVFKIVDIKKAQKYKYCLR